MSLESPIPKIVKHQRRTYQSIILSEGSDSRFEARFLRQSVFYGEDGGILFIVDDPDPIIIKSEELSDRPDLVSGVMLIQQEVDRRDQARQ